MTSDRTHVALYTRAPDDELERLRQLAAEVAPGVSTEEYIDPPGGRVFDGSAWSRLRKAMEAGRVSHLVSLEIPTLVRDLAEGAAWVRVVLGRGVDLCAPGTAPDVFAGAVEPFRRLLHKSGGAPPGNQNRAGKTKFTPKQEERVRGLRVAGLSIRAIAERTGISTAGVDRILRRSPSRSVEQGNSGEESDT